MSILTSLKNTPKNWFKFVRFTKNGEYSNFRWERLPGFNMEEYLNFQCNYFVTHELTHVVAGIYKNPEAIKEYKRIQTRESLNPSKLLSMYCLNNKNNDVIAINSMTLHKKGEPFNNNKIIQGKTEEVNRLLKIDNELRKLCPISDIMAKYDVDVYSHDDEVAIKPEFRGLGMMYEISKYKYNICKMYGASLTGGWCTSVETQKATLRGGWELEYEVSTKDLEKILKITFNNAPPTLQYKIHKIDFSSI